MGLDLGQPGDGLRRLSCLMAQWEIICRHLSEGDAFSSNTLARAAGTGGSHLLLKHAFVNTADRSTLMA